MTGMTFQQCATAPALTAELLCPQDNSSAPALCLPAPGMGGSGSTGTSGQGRDKLK